MADVVTSQILENGPRFAVAKFTSLSDGTGEAGVTKVDATASGTLGVVFQGQTFFPGVNLKVVDLWYNVANMALRIQWHASSNVDMAVLEGNGHWKFLHQRGGFQGLVCPTVAGATGSIDFTTTDQVAGGPNVPPGSYTIIMTLVKGIPQS